MSKFKLIGIIALITIIGFSLIGCGSKGGGTLVIENKTGDLITAWAVKGDKIPDTLPKPIEVINNTIKTLITLDEDGTVYFEWYYKDGTVGKAGNINIKGGNDYKLPAEKK
jgi:hypothetical protein